MRLFINIFTAAYRLVRYNLKIIFANKFIYFLAAGLGIFLFVTIINLLDADAQPTEATVYWLLFLPGILLIFYPVTFGIQNDVDNRMIEILFGIPDYRYKVWLLRLALIFTVAGVILLLLSVLSYFALTALPVFEMVFQLMFPIVFLGCTAFMMSTIVRNGSGTAVVMVVLGMACWIARPFFNNHRKWDIFINPFTLPDNMNEVVWAEIVLNNRIYLLVGIVLALLYGLLNLQKREKFL